MNPRKSAPGRRQRASSQLVIPQILTFTLAIAHAGDRHCAASSNVAQRRAGIGDPSDARRSGTRRIRPREGAPDPHACASRIRTRRCIPRESLRSTPAKFPRALERAQVAIIDADDARARGQRAVSSSRVCTSTSGSISARARARAIRTAARRPAPPQSARNESAFAARASHTCHGSTMKSFRSTGICVPSSRFFQIAKDLKEILFGQHRKRRRSRGFETCARRTGSKSARINPREGDAFFSSAITLKPSRESATAKSRAGEAFSFAAIFKATSGSTRLRCATDSRRTSTMRSRIVFLA